MPCPSQEVSQKCHHESWQVGTQRSARFNLHCQHYNLGEDRERHAMGIPEQGGWAWQLEDQIQAENESRIWTPLLGGSRPTTGLLGSTPLFWPTTTLLKVRGIAPQPAPTLLWMQCKPPAHLLHGKLRLDCNTMNIIYYKIYYFKKPFLKHKKSAISDLAYICPDDSDLEKAIWVAFLWLLKHVNVCITS